MFPFLGREAPNLVDLLD